MSITPEQAAEMQNRVLRLAKARPYNSPIIDEINALVTPEGLVKTEKRMMKTLNVKQTKDQPEYKIQAAYVRTMNTRHPDILVFSDCAARVGFNWSAGTLFCWRGWMN